MQLDFLLFKIKLKLIMVFCIFLGYQDLQTTTTVIFLECSEGFYRVNGSDVCTPSCHTWTEYSKDLSIFVNVVVCISAVAGFLVSVADIVFSCLSYKRM